MHTHTVKWINASRELCHLIYQQTCPSRPCLAGSEVGARELTTVLAPSRQDWVLAHRRQQGVLQTSSPASTQTQRMPRDVCQGLPKQPTGGCISLGRINPHFTKEYRTWLYKPVVAELRMPPAAPWGTGGLCNLMMLQHANSNDTFFLRWSHNSRLARAEQRAELAHLLYVSLWLCYFTWMGLEFTSNLLWRRA